MEKIYQSRDIPFFATTVQDAIIIVPLMDTFIRELNKRRYAELWDNLSSEERKEKKLRYPSHHNELPEMTTAQIANAYKFFIDRGFVGSGNVSGMTDEELLAENAKD
jgi:hypothetical protein